jgi:hypothetical protein
MHKRLCIPSISNDTLIPYVLNFKLWFNLCHFIFRIGYVTSIIALLFNFYPFCCFPENDLVNGRHMYEVNVCKNYFTNMYFVVITIILYILRRLFKNNYLVLCSEVRGSDLEQIIKSHNCNVFCKCMITGTQA